MAGPRQYDDLQATQVYCPTCRAAMPVRERLLLALPTGDLYLITCARCGAELAKQTRKTGPDGIVVPGNPYRR